MPAETSLRRLKSRPEFLRIQRNGRRFATPGFVLQACPVRPGTAGAAPRAAGDIGFGLTASRKVGNAVARNRARRRLRALAVEGLPGMARPGVDYVIIARSGTNRRSWTDLQQDLRLALKRLKMLATGPSGDPAPDRSAS